MGDGLFLAFADAADAVSACIEMQRDLGPDRWPAGGKVRVRIGLHTGPGQPTAHGDYDGVAVHKAARVCSAAHGGQILMSSETASRVRPALTGGASLVDRGWFLLSGFDEP